MQDVVHSTDIETDASRAMRLAVTVALAREGDEDAFAWLFEYYKGPLGGRLSRLVRDQEVAYDIYQDVFITVFRAFKERTPIPEFQPWLYRVAKNRAIDHLRHKKILEFVSLSETKADDPEECTLPELLREEGHEERILERECLKQALAEMSPQYRICVLLQEEWGYLQKEIAVMLGITEKAVSSNVTRGRKQLHAAYLRAIAHIDAVRKGGQS